MTIKIDYQASVIQDGEALRNPGGKLVRSLADIYLDVSWPSDMPAQAVLDQLDPMVNDLRRQIAAHQEQTND